MLTRIVSTEPLTTAEAESWAPARAKRLASSLAGRARYILELLQGYSYCPDDGATPLNPQGAIGIDRSGPPWGDAHLHPLWVVEYAAGSVVYGESPSVSLTTQGQIERITARFFVRPFAVAPLVPYSQIYFRGQGSRIGGAGTATATVRIYGPEVDSGPSTSATISTTGTASFGTGAFCVCRPGWNERVIEFELTSTVGLDLGCVSLNQVVRRSH
jgi:hypothetical protein